MRAPLHLFLPRRLIDECRAEATRTFPLETGGVFMGERVTQDRWQVDHVIGPGPGALHERHRFTPDPEWQHERIAERFLATGGRSTYLGDWHSHPGAHHGRLSFVDRCAARTILRSAESQCDRLLMVIAWGRPEEWELGAWACELHGGWIWNGGVSVAPIDVDCSDG